MTADRLPLVTGIRGRSWERFGLQTAPGTGHRRVPAGEREESTICDLRC